MISRHLRIFGNRDWHRPWILWTQWMVAYGFGFLMLHLIVWIVAPETREKRVFLFFSLEVVLILLFALPTFLVLRYHFRFSWWYCIPWIAVTGIAFYGYLIYLDQIAVRSIWWSIAVLGHGLLRGSALQGIVLGLLQSLILYFGLRRELPFYRAISSWRWVLVTVLAYEIGGYLFFKVPSEIRPYMPLFILACLQGAVLANLLSQWKRSQQAHSSSGVPHTA